MTAAMQNAGGVRSKQPPRGRQAAAQPLFWLLLVFLVLEYVRPAFFSQLKLQLLISLILPICCYSQIKDRAWSPLLTLQLVFLGLCALHIPFALNNYSAYFVTRVLYGSIAISISMFWLFSDMALLRRGLWWWLLIMTYVGIFGLTHGGTGPGGFLGDENDLALACNTALPFAFFGFEWAKGVKRWIYGAAGVVLVAAVVASFSRGGFLGLASTGLYCFLVSKNKLRNLGVVLIAAVAFLVLAPGEYLEEISGIRREATGNVEGGTGEARRFLWLSAFNMWKAYPMFGVGAGNYNWWVGTYQPDWAGANYEERNWTGQATHSVYFQLLAEHGTVGTGVWVALITLHLLLLRRLRRQARRKKRLPNWLTRDIEMYSGALSGAMVGYMASGAFLSVAYHPYVWYFTGIAAALGVATDRALAGQPPNHPAGRPARVNAPEQPVPPAPRPRRGAVNEGTASLGRLSDLLGNRNRRGRNRSR